MKKIIIFTAIILLILIVGVVFFTITSNANENENLVSKTDNEIKYLEEKIIDIMNNLNQITFSDTVLIEEKTQDENKGDEKTNSQQNETTEESSQRGDTKTQKESNNSKSSSSSQESNASSQNNENTSDSSKYEIKNNSILVSKTDNINWNYIKSNVENTHSIWSNLILDLHSLNVNQQDILNFSSVLDQITINAKTEDKTTLLNNLASLYSFLPKYREQIYKETNKEINVDYTIACILNSYAFSEQGKWDEANFQLSNAINYFTNIMNNTNIQEDNKNKINKTYILLNELNNSSALNDKDLFLIKYRNVMEELLSI